jgi:hypothetical protein
MRLIIEVETRRFPVGVKSCSGPPLPTENVLYAARDQPRDQLADCRQNGANLLFSIPHVVTFVLAERLFLIYVPRD